MSDPDTRDLILPSDLCERVSHWHGGQFTATYALCSTGLSHHVSVAMVEAAADELEGPCGPYDTPDLRADREALVGELRDFVTFADEHRAE